MAIETTTVQGMILDGNGDGVGGKVTVTLSSPCKVSDGTDNHVVAFQKVFEVPDTGNVSFVLIPNDVLTPLEDGAVIGDSRYSVKYEMNGVEPYEETWNVATAPDPVDIGDITRG